MVKNPLIALAIGSIFLLSINIKSAIAINLSCAVNATSIPLNISQVSGIWYEVSRFPPTKMPACLMVYAPNTVEDNEYVLQLKYVNNLNNKWKHTEENITFPWNDHTQNGLFEIVYTDGHVAVDINFKLVRIVEDFAFVCGYSGLSPAVSIIHVLSREAIVSTDMKNKVNKLLEMFGTSSSELTWVEQGPKCNGASDISSKYVIIVFTLLMFIYLKT